MIDSDPIEAHTDRRKPSAGMIKHETLTGGATSSRQPRGIGASENNQGEIGAADIGRLNEQILCTLETDARQIIKEVVNP